MKDFKLTVHLRWRLKKKKFKGKMNKSRHFLKNSKRVKSAQSQPSFGAEAWERRPGSDCSRSGQKPPADQVLIYFFFAILLLATHIEDEEFLKIIRSQPSTVETKEKKTAASSTSCYSIKTVRVISFLLLK